MSSKSIALFQAHRDGEPVPFDPRDRKSPTLPPPAGLASDLLKRARSLRSIGSRLLAEANELETAAHCISGRDLP
jgi:hypothetical protein